jgi:queuine tRNA-ribosyltransferase
MKAEVKHSATCGRTAARTLAIEIRGKRFETPNFMPVATTGAIRGMGLESVIELEFPVLLSNTYHLMLRPGADRIARLGGLHQFINWPNLILTDSGGFQIFSLPNARIVSDDGAVFKSYIDGSTIHLTPESCIATQEKFGSDIMMVLDVCEPSTVDIDTARAALAITNKWALRCLKARTEKGGALFPIVQGALFTELRKESAEFLRELPFDGFAIGGLAVGERRVEREDTTAFTAALLPVDRPRYLMGVGTPIDLLEAVHRGIDMFDCILPTALAQQGVAYTSRGKVDCRRGVYAEQNLPLDPNCPCHTCLKFSRAYLHHLIKSKETRAGMLIGHHNLTFYRDLTETMRTAIIEDRFFELYTQQRPLLDQMDIDYPTRQPKRKARKSVSKRFDIVEGFIEEAGKEKEFFYTVRELRSGEKMHSVSKPQIEADLLYVQQTQLRERLLKFGDTPYTIWDVGLGAAINASAAIRCALELEASGLQNRALFLVSFERDLEPVKLVLDNHEKFPEIAHAALRQLVEQGEYRTGKLHWQLFKGDFLQTMQVAPSPDLIFYDPFSPATDQRMWGASAFRMLRQTIGARQCMLATYSCSTAVRAALLEAGFFVGYGCASGPKESTTVAYTQHHPDFHYLDADWISRWERSSSRYPFDIDPTQRTEFDERILKHAQFRVAAHL